MQQKHLEDEERLQADRGKRYEEAAAFIDAIPHKRATRFDNMTKAEIKIERLKDRGLI